MPCPCRVHAVPLPCSAAKGLECVFPIWFTQCGRVWFTLAMPCSDHAVLLKATAQYSTAVSRRPCCAMALRRTAWSENGMGAARHGRETSWAQHGHGMLCVNRPLYFLLIIITAIFGLASAVDCLTSPTRDVRPDTGRASDGAFGQRLSIKQKNKTPYKLAWSCNTKGPKHLTKL